MYIKQRMLKHKEDEQMEQDLVAVKKKLGELVVSINEYIEELRYQVKLFIKAGGIQIKIFNAENI